MTFSHYSDGRRYSCISGGWILNSSWNDREEIASLLDEIKQLSKRIKQLEDRALDDYSAWLNIAHDLGAKDGDNALEFISVRVDQSLNAIRMLLPLAKGYAAAHPLPINNDIVQNADAFLQSLDNPDDL